MFKNLITNRIVVHFIGNKSLEEGVKLSKKIGNTDEEMKFILSDFFINSFKSSELYNLYHQGDLKFNEVYGYVSEIFDEPGSFYDNSVNLARRLYEKSTHPKVKSGEFCVVYFEDCEIQGEKVDALGLFKSENKDVFLKIIHADGNFIINSEEGININKLDKGCLIFNTEKEKGYLVSIVDHANKGNDAQYWKEDFLNVRPCIDDYHHTQNILTMCKNFVVDRLPESFEVSKADQVDMLNKSVNFFKEKNTFSMDDFTSEVIQSPEVISVFNQYKKEFSDEREIEIYDEFNISAPAVKKQQRIFKSVIKLDKNFHIYIHGNKELIERGYDEVSGMHYYKVFFKEEN